MFSNNKINLTFYTQENSTFINEKPTFKSDHPEWSKFLKSTFKNFDPRTNSSFDVATAKNCPGINNVLNEGIKFKMWTDLKLRVHPSGLVENLPMAITFSIPPVVQHFEKQYEHIYQDNKTACKLNNPWIAKCNKDVKFLFMEPHYSTNFFREHNIQIAPGIIDFKYQSALNIHLIMEKRKDPYEILIPYGTPLMTLYPMTDKKIKINYELISDLEYKHIQDAFPKCPLRKYYQLIKNLN
jgi:hypothetical protein